MHTSPSVDQLNAIGAVLRESPSSDNDNLRRSSERYFTRLQFARKLEWEDVDKCEGELGRVDFYSNRYCAEV